MQMAVIEFARHVCKLRRANSEEIDPKTPHPVIHIMPGQKELLAKKQYGGTIRLGGWPCKIIPNTHLAEAYAKYTNKKVNINQQANSFAVAIPMLTKQIKIMRTQSTSRVDDGYVRARKHVDELKEFYYSLISYCVVIPFLIFIWYRFTPDTIQWFWFPMFGWGIGLVFQAYKVFVNDGVLGRNWEKRKIDEFMQEEEKQNWN